MDSITLHSCVQYLAHGSADVFAVAKDYLSEVRVGSKNLIVICNTAESFTSGAHWVAFYTYFSPYGEVLTDYYDSFARPPSFYGIYYPYPITNFNSVVHQTSDSDYCGQLVLYFLYLRLRRFPLSHALSALSTDKEKNEKIAVSFFEKIVTVAGRNIRPGFQCGRYGCLPKEQVKVLTRLYS